MPLLLRYNFFSSWTSSNSLGRSWLILLYDKSSLTISGGMLFGTFFNSGNINNIQVIKPPLAPFCPYHSYTCVAEASDLTREKDSSRQRMPIRTSLSMCQILPKSGEPRAWHLRSHSLPSCSEKLPQGRGKKSREQEATQLNWFSHKEVVGSCLLPIESARKLHC